MPHTRFRHLQPTIMKSLSFWPIVCLVGSRQVGKSTLLRNLKNFSYHTFDDAGTQELAARNPGGILNPPCAIDEAQKVPRIFDAVKINVDKEKRPGKFILTGSVRFSTRTLIRESLTGRAKTVQMFPLTCSETLSFPFQNRWFIPERGKPRITRKEFESYLSKGGMPVVFAARNLSETSSYWAALTESYVYRDLLLAVPKNPRPELALHILKAIAEILALGELPTFSRILKKVGGTRHILERHIFGLEDMMIVRRIGHLGGSRTKDIFMLFDPAFFLNLLRIQSPLHDTAIHLTCIYIVLMNEILATQQASDRPLELQYALSPSGEIVQLITRDKKGVPIFWKIAEEPIPHTYEMRFLEAIAHKNKGIARVLSSVETRMHLKGVQIMPWESML